MSEGVPNPKAEKAFGRAPAWEKEMRALRAIALSRPLVEEVKWGWPCYTHEGKTVVLIHAFKDYCAYAFFKGALMKDPKRLLIQQTENVQSGRQIRFASLGEIEALAPTLRNYIDEATAIEAAGLKVEKRAPADEPMPEEFQTRLDASAKLRAAYEALTPGRRRAYLLHFNGAKQSATRAARVDKCAPLILSGKGLDD